MFTGPEAENLSPDPQIDLRTRLRRYLQGVHASEAILASVRPIFDQAVRAEAVLLSRSEHDRLLKLVIRDIVEEMQAKL